MTLITDYVSLQTAITDEWLARDTDAVIKARAPTFIQFAEAKFNRELFVRQMETRATALVDMTSMEPEYISLPADFQSMRRIRLSSVSGKPRLDFKSTVELDEYRTSIGDASSQPTCFTIFGTEIELAPTPDAAYTLEMVYRATVPPLATNSTNWLLALAPDIYLYGALLESAPYIKDDARIQVWVAGFTTALDSINRLGMTSTFNAGPLAMRASGVTP